MKIYKVGEKSQIICPTCGLVDITLTMRDIVVQAHRPIIINTITGVCDICTEVVATFPQSTPDITNALNEKTN